MANAPITFPSVKYWAKRANHDHGDISGRSCTLRQTRQGGALFTSNYEYRKPHRRTIVKFMFSGGRTRRLGVK